MASFTDDLRKFVNSSLLSDVDLLIGPHEVLRHGHSFLLRARSSYFEAALDSDTEETPKRTIRLPNIDPATFDRILDYLYTGEVVMDLDYLARIYDAASQLHLERMMTACKQLVRESLTSENALAMLATIWEAEDLRAMTVSFIHAHADVLLTDRNLAILDHEMLMEVIPPDGLDVDELLIWKAIVAWAMVRCGLCDPNTLFPVMPQWPGRILVLLSRTPRAHGTRQHTSTGGEGGSENQNGEGEGEEEEEGDDEEDDPSLPALQPQEDDEVVLMSSADHRRLRETLAPLLGLVRFERLSVDDYFRLVESTRLVPPEISLQVYRHHAVSEYILGSRIHDWHL
ncbi:hypothetical protein BGZ73_004015 [Actinomortierella ambigua]|nr:hypothetical protein BGZ73_004015 [Actinomortierella ambigua]